MSTRDGRCIGQRTSHVVRSGADDRRFVRDRVAVGRVGQGRPKVETLSYPVSFIPSARIPSRKFLYPKFDGEVNLRFIFSFARPRGGVGRRPLSGVGSYMLAVTFRHARNPQRTKAGASTASFMPDFVLGWPPRPPVARRESRDDKSEHSAEVAVPSSSASRH